MLGSAPDYGYSFRFWVLFLHAVQQVDSPKHCARDIGVVLLEIDDVALYCSAVAAGHFAKSRTVP